MVMVYISVKIAVTIPLFMFFVSINLIFCGDGSSIITITGVMFMSRAWRAGARGSRLESTSSGSARRSCVG
jgi:hypothetical protein